MHAPIDRDPNWDNMTKSEKERSGVFIEMPRGFREGGKVLKLHRSLYGLKQSARHFFNLLKDNLEAIGFYQSKQDPCLFLSEKVICLVYVDDTLFYARNVKDIDEIIIKLRDQYNMELEEENDVAGFLGVHINKKENGSIELLQDGLIERIIRALNLEDRPGKSTPVEFGTLDKDIGDEERNETFSYPTV